MSPSSAGAAGWTGAAANPAHAKITSKLPAATWNRPTGTLMKFSPLGTQICAEALLPLPRIDPNCHFGLPTGWRGAIARMIMRLEPEVGPGPRGLVEEPTILPSVEMPGPAANRRTLRWVFLGEHGLRAGWRVLL